MREAMEKMRTLSEGNSGLMVATLTRVARGCRATGNERVFLNNVTKTDLYRIPAGLRFLQWFVDRHMVRPGCETNKVAIFTGRHNIMDAANGCMTELLQRLDTTHADSNVARTIVIRSGVTNERRKKLIHCLATEPACRTGILGFLSGGSSIELSMVNFVILIGMCLNASDYDQALARAMRLSQTRNVTNYIVLLDDSMDVIVFNELVCRKADQTSQVIHGHRRELEYESMRF
jgi:hypothetical protein